MRKEELRHLMGMDYEEFNELLRVNDARQVKTALRKAMMRLHPDNPTTGNQDRFMQLRELYKLISNSDLTAVIDDYSSDEVVVDVDETRKPTSSVVDILGNYHDKKEVLRGDCKVRIKASVYLDGVVYPVEYKVPYRPDNRYELEIRPIVNKADFIAHGAHSLRVTLTNTYDKVSSSMEWNGCSVTVRTRMVSDKLIVNFTVAVRLTAMATLDEA